MSRSHLQANACRYWIATLIAIVGAALLVIQWAGGRMLWLDEEMIAINLRDRTMRQLAGPLSLAQAAPYGWLLLQRAIVLLFGTGERALRFLPMAFGVATLATAVGIGRRWMTPIGAAALAYLCSAGQWLSFYALELKHYSADACLALLLPALAVRAMESGGIAGIRSCSRHVIAWWITAALAPWIANGALFVTPLCAVVLVLNATRFGWRAGVAVASPGVIWLVSFAVNYFVTLRPALANDFLRQYWTNAFPPAGVGLIGTARWLSSQFVPLAINPGGSGFAYAFWMMAAIGFCLAPRYSTIFRLSFALVPVSAFVWAGIRLVPLYERLSLWIAPALYVGVAMAVEANAAWIMDALARRRWTRLVAGVAAAGLFIAIFADIYGHGMTYVRLRPHTANHALNDRGAVTWLARQARPRDVWVTTRNALPAFWWYAEAVDKTAILEASFRTDPSSCGAEEIGAWLAAGERRRVLVYLGFGHDMPKEFDHALLARLGSVGVVTAYRPFGPNGHAIIVELGTPSARSPTLSALSGRRDDPLAPAVRGCVAVEAARPW